jgi:sensor domain CHASE-containing protein
MAAASIDDQPQQASKTTSILRRRKWILIATFVVTYLLAAVIAGHINETHSDSRRLATQMIAQGYAQRLQERLQTALVSTYVLASVVKQSGGQVSNFNNVAAELITLFPGVSALQLAPDGVIQEIYPLAGNEAAIGHDLLADRKRNREAAAAITTQQLTLAGPFNLIQGGVGAVGRLPVFITNERNDSHFWGFANALIRIPNLLEAAGFDGLTKAGYRYELARINPDTEQRQVFARSGEQPPVAPVEYVITVYNGHWILSLAPENGWMTVRNYVEIFAYGLLVACIATLLQFFCIRALLATRRD